MSIEYTTIGAIFLVLVFSALYVYRRWVSVILLSIAGVLALAQMDSLLSKPKPTTLEFLKRSVQSAQVHWAQPASGTGIYVILTWKGQSEPRLYMIPWNEKMAKQLGIAQERSRAGKGKVMLSRPFTSPQLDGKHSGQRRGTSAFDGGISTKPGVESLDNVSKEMMFYNEPPPPQPPKDSETEPQPIINE